MHPDVVFSVLFAIIYCAQSQGWFEKSYLLSSEAWKNKAYEGRFEKHHLVVQRPGVYLTTHIQYHSLIPSMCLVCVHLILQYFKCIALSVLTLENLCENG